MTTEEELDWFGGPCWFCSAAPPVAGGSVVVKIFKMTSPTEVLHSSVSVPRCEACRDGHGRVNRLAGLVAASGATLVGLVVFAWNPLEMPVWGQVLAVVLGLGPGGYLMGGTLGLPAGVRPESTAAGYPGLHEMMRNGWVVDDPILKDLAEAALREAR